MLHDTLLVSASLWNFRPAMSHATTPVFPSAMNILLSTGENLRLVMVVYVLCGSKQSCVSEEYVIPLTVIRMMLNEQHLVFHHQSDHPSSPPLILSMHATPVSVSQTDSPPPLKWATAMRVQSGERVATNKFVHAFIQSFCCSHVPASVFTYFSRAPVMVRNSNKDDQTASLSIDWSGNNQNNCCIWNWGFGELFFSLS